MGLKTTALLAAGITFTSAFALAGGTQIGSGTVAIKCTTPVAEMVAAEMNVTAIDVEVIQLNGKYAGKVNNQIHNRDIQAVEHKIKDISAANLDNIDSQDLNEAERRLVHLQSMLEQGFAEPLSFDVTKATTAKILDLDGDSSRNKFGGAVLMELFDQNGSLLGRVFSSLLVGECR